MQDSAADENGYIMSDAERSARASRQNSCKFTVSLVEMMITTERYMFRGTATHTIICSRRYAHIAWLLAYIAWSWQRNAAAADIHHLYRQVRIEVWRGQRGMQP